MQKRIHGKKQIRRARTSSRLLNSFFIKWSFENLTEMTESKDLRGREKQELQKRYVDMPKCSQQEAVSILEISQTTLFNLLKQRDAISDEIEDNRNLSSKKNRD